jgi:hypothetical protein
MHHALLIPDVRAYIFAFIKEDKQMGRCTFAILARTCSALSEASLDVLWSELDSLRPLASCIYAANTMPLSDEACLLHLFTTSLAESSHSSRLKPTMT